MLIFKTTALYALLCIMGCILLNQKQLEAQTTSKYPSILWEIKKTPQSKPSYLFGSYHVSDKGVFKLGDSIFIALKSVDMVATEINDGEWQQNDDYLTKMSSSYNLFNAYFSGTNISEVTFRKTNTIEKIPIFIRVKPNAINYFLYRNSEYNEGYQEEAYLDRFLSLAGYKYGKKIAGLENYMESEVLLMQGKNDEKDIEKKENQKLPDGLTYNEINTKIFDGYKNGDLSMMDSLEKFNYSSKEFYQKFIIQRNYNQADSLDYYIKKGNTIFGIVGSAHLIGNEGVIEILRKKGYMLRPVKLQGHAKEEIDHIKKIVIPVTNKSFTIDDEIKYKAPGRLYEKYSNSVVKLYAYVDMANGAYYQLTRLYNNSSYFGYTPDRVQDAIDSLLYANVQGDIISKQKTTYKGYPCVDVTSQLKNKDFERYKFIVTPYELINIRCGGKNDYAKSAIVDEFLNAFEFQLATKKINNYGVSASDIQTTYHAWLCNDDGKHNTKVRLTNINENAEKCIIKLLASDDAFRTKDEYIQLAMESLVSSLALDKEVYKNIVLYNIKDGEIYTFALQNGDKIMVRFTFNNPYILAAMVRNGDLATNTTWLKSVQVVDVPTTHNYTFTDKLKAISVQLPYQLSFNLLWQKETERKEKKYAKKNEPNRPEVLNYKPVSIAESPAGDYYSFQHPNTMDMIEIATFTIDSNFYFGSTSDFWKKFVPQPSFAKSDNSAYNSIDYGPNSYTSNDMNSGGTPITKVTIIKADTTSATGQFYECIVTDSVNHKAIYYKFLLVNKYVYRFKVQVAATSFAINSFAKNIMGSFKSIHNNSNNVYDDKLTGWMKKYTAASAKEKPELAGLLNYYRPDTKDVEKIKSVYHSLSNKKAEEVIIKRKLLAAIAYRYYENEDWKPILAFLKNIFEDNKELITLRYYALRQILEQHNKTDADYIYNKIVKDSTVFINLEKDDIESYLRSIKMPATYKGKFPAPTSFTEASKLYIDSAYYPLPIIKKLFEESIANDRRFEFQAKIAAEKSLFKYPEESLEKEKSNDKYKNSFTSITKKFSIFYPYFPADPIFEKYYANVKENGTPNDKITLLAAFVRSKYFNKEWANQLVIDLGKEQRLKNVVIKMYHNSKLLSLLPKDYINNVEFAKNYLLEKSFSNNPPDTIYHVKTIAYLYSKTDSVYFFKYRDENDINDEYAYIILPNSSKMFDMDLYPVHDKTNEQEVNGESFQTIANRILRKNYIRKLYNKVNNARGYKNAFYTDEDVEKSIRVSE
jgi:uncharacterized protein YbaP (TraB family)